MDSVVSLALIVSVCSSVYIFAYAVDLDFEKMTNGQFWLFSIKIMTVGHYFDGNY